MNGQLGLYDLQGKIKKSYSGHVNKDFCMDVGCYKYKGSTVLIGGSEDGSVCMWDLQTQKLMARRQVSQGVCSSVDYNPHLGIVAANGDLRGYHCFKI